MNIKEGRIARYKGDGAFLFWVLKVPKGRLEKFVHLDLKTYRVFFFGGMSMSDASLFAGITMLSLEQAVDLPYLSYRLALDGVKVIRIERPFMVIQTEWRVKTPWEKKCYAATFFQSTVKKKRLPSIWEP